MKKEIAEAWVKDLRANPPQTDNVLYDGRGYCCLGRLCVVMGYEFVPSDHTGRQAPTKAGIVFTDGVGLSLPRKIKDEAGLKHNEGEFPDWLSFDDVGPHRSLAGLNDSDVSFSDIADFIEKNWEHL